MQPTEAPVEVVPTPVEPPIESTFEPAVHAPAQTALEIHTKKIPRQRHFLILFFFSFMWGTFGVDRMYMGLYASGILKLLTVGGLGFWTLSDFIIIMTGTFKDKQGRPALQFNEYRKFAGRTILWFTIIVALVVLVNGILLILSITQLIGAFQGGGTGGIPGLDQLTGGSDRSQINSLLGQ
jgi:TM2 domain-containing membrane protein YozV